MTTKPQSTTEPRLEPCPFCGASAFISWDGDVNSPDDWSANCDNTLDCGATVGGMCSEDAARKAWNTRLKQPHCWHCGIVLEATELRPRCDECSADCDDEFCNAFGCAPSTAATAAPSLYSEGVDDAARVARTLNNVAAENSLLAKIATICDLGSAEEFGDALERLQSIRRLIDEHEGAR